MFSTRFRRPARPALLAAVAMAAALAATAASALAAGVADYIPGDALIVFKVNKLKAVSDKAGKLATDFGLAAQNPDAADPLAALKKQTGFANGINDDGDFAFYTANAHLDAFDADDDEMEEPNVLLVPVSDYDAFVSNLKDTQDAGDGVTSGTLAGEDGDESTVYVMKMGDYAAVSTYQDLVKKPAKAIEFDGVTGDSLDKRDATFYANFKQLGPMLKAEMDKEGNKEKAKQEFLDGFKNNPQAEKFAPVAEAGFDQLYLAAESFLRDADAAAISVNLSDPGIGLGVIAQFKPDSYLGKLLPNHKTSGDSLLAGLPEGAYLLYGGSVADKEFNKTLFTDLLGPVVAKLKDVQDAGPLREYIETAQSTLQAMGDARFGVYSPSGALGQTPLLQEVVIQEGDAKQLMAAQKKMAELTPQIVKSLAGDDAGAAAMNQSYTPDAKTVAGVSFAKFTTTLPENQDMGQDPSQFIFGPDGPTSYSGEVDGKLLTVMGLSDQQIEAVVASVKGSKDPLADVRGVKFVSGQLPDKRAAVVYLQPDELVRSVSGFARQMQMNVNVQLPDDLPPVGIALAPEKNSLTVDSFVSKDLVQAMVAAYLQVQQQFQGNGPGGGL